MTTRLRSILTFVGLAVGLPSVAMAGPKAALLSPASVDLGTFTAERPPQVKFTVRNGGDGPLTFRRIRTTCGGCISVALPDPLGAGQSTEVVVKIKPVPAGKPFRRTIYLETDAVDARMMRLQVTGRPVSMFGITPSSTVQLGHVAASRQISCTWLITPRDRSTTRLGTPKLAGVSTGLNNATARIASAENGVGWQLLLTGEASAAAGALRAQVAVPIEGATEGASLVLTALGTVGRKLVVVPSVVPVPLDPDSGGSAVVTIGISGTKGTDRMDPSALRVDPPDGLRAAIEPLGGNRVRLRVGLARRADAALLRPSRLRVVLRYPGVAPATVRLLPGSADARGGEAR